MRRDHRRNLDILKDLDIHKDIVQVLHTRRLTYFGHVTRMGSDRGAIHICFCMDTHTVVIQKEDRGRSGWTTSMTTARRWAFQSMRLCNLLPTGQDGGTLYAIWTASAHWQHHCRHGNKSSQARVNSLKYTLLLKVSDLVLSWVGLEVHHAVINF